MDPHRVAIVDLAGNNPDPEQYSFDQAGLQAYLAGVGIKHFSATELTNAHRPQIAQKLYGKTILLPRQSWWPRAAALCLLAERLREHSGRPITIYNWYRPADYNRAAKGAPGSDHITACAIDLRFESSPLRRRAEEYLMQIYRAGKWRLSLGLGHRIIHLGMLSPGGRRLWHYAGHEDYRA